MLSRLVEKLLSKDILELDDNYKKIFISHLKQSLMLEELLKEDKTGHCILLRNNVFYVNKSFFPLLRADVIIPHKTLGKKLDNFITDNDILSFLNVKKQDKKEFYFEYGSDDFKVISVVKSKIELDGINYAHISVKDITEDKKKETQLRRSESLANMSNMAAAIAHEIKNPLASMKIHLYNIEKRLNRKGVLTQEDISEQLDILKEEVERLNSLAVDFLFTLRPISFVFILDDIENALQNAIKVMQSEADENNVKISLEVQSYLPKLNIDITYMKQVFINIISNAIKAISDGGEINIKVKEDGDYILTTISDTGSGIAKDVIEKIFQPYFTTRKDGFGLGLAIVYKIVKEHGGFIEVKSKEGKGTQFYIRLPKPISQRKKLGDII